MAAEAWDMKYELIDLIKSKGGNPDDQTSVSGAFHRAWIAIKDTFASDKVESTLENVVLERKQLWTPFKMRLTAVTFASKAKQ